MELRDFIVTPIIIILVFVGAYFVRPRVTDAVTRRYFFPALAVKIFGAICLGMVYQFYYSGGDTFMYHTYGSRLIWNAILDSPLQGLTLIFRGAGNYTDVYKYASQIYFFRDPASYFVVRFAAIFDLLTFSTYSATAALFAVFGFSGTWAMYLTFYKQYPNRYRALAIAICFFPSVFFWGSGILKETIVMGSLGLSTYLFYSLFITRKVSFTKLLMLLVSLYFIFCVKKFVLQAYLPAVLAWILASNFNLIQSVALKLVLTPLVILAAIISSFYAIVKVGEGDAKYDINRIAQTAKVTAYDIRYWSGRDAGSGYDIGELDGTFQSIIGLAPRAINVALFRPYLWEVKNPLMLMSAIESLLLLIFALYILFRKQRMFFAAFTNANVVFLMLFSLSFSFAVGVSTFNFGTLARYKIPMLPFFVVGLILILDYSKRDKKLAAFDSTEK